MSRPKRPPSWAAIIIWLIFFWPVGLYFLLKRLTTDREAAVRKDGKTPVLGWIMMFAGIIILYSYFGGGYSGDTRLIIAIFLLCGSVAALSAARKSNHDSDRYRRYIDAIVNHGMVSVREIAAYVHVNESRAYMDLKKMIRMRYFDHAHIDERRGEIHIYQRHGPTGQMGGIFGPGAGRGFGSQGFGGQSNSGQSYNGQSYGGQSYGGQDYSGQSYNGQSYSGQSYDGSSYSTQGFEEQTSPGRSGPAFDGGGQGAQTVEVMMACRNCGAHNWVQPGVRNFCEFCGSPLSTEYQ